MKALIGTAGASQPESSNAKVELTESARSLLDAVTGMAYRRVNDGKWSIVYISSGCRELLGFDPDEMMGSAGRGYASYIHPSDQQAFRDESEHMSRRKKNFSMAYVTKHKHGSDRWVWDSGVGVYDAYGKLLYVDGMVSDCSGYKKIQSGMRCQISEFRDYFSNCRFGDMIGKSPSIQMVFSAIIQVAQVDESVIIYGESGTGKELVAREIHRVSSRKMQPFIPVNCGAIPENLMESELFGYRKGAFSGADKDKKGLLEVAHGGTLFLDEVGEIPQSMQVKLLRALEGDGFIPMGGCEVIQPDIRVVAATNRNLAEMVKNGHIRSDFFYRINVIPVHLPSLRERKEDIPLLVAHFLDCSDKDCFLPGKFLKVIMDYDWPGNVRELKNQIHQYMALGFMDITRSCNDTDTSDMQRISLNGNTLQEHVQRCESDAISTALFEYQWNRTKTAKALGIDRRTLFAKIRKYGLEIESEN